MSEIETRRAPCCAGSVVTFHFSGCTPRANDRPELLGCDAEDGAVWVRVGLSAVKVPAERAREFADQLHEAARGAVKHGG